MQFIEGNKIRDVIVVGDRVLIKPDEQSSQTKSGLYLPPGVKEKEQIQKGSVVKVGPGYPILGAMEDLEVWQKDKEAVKYMPLQVQEGDTAIFLQNSGHEISYGDEKFMIVPQSAILMLVRDEESLD